MRDNGAVQSANDYSKDEDSTPSLEDYNDCENSLATPVQGDFIFFGEP